MSNLLGSTAALDTYAQVANGIPVPRVPRFGEEDDDPWWLEENPDPEPSQEVHEIAKTVRDGFCVETAEFDVQVAQRFQDENPASREFFLLLIEVVVILCHDIAATLFNMLKGGLRKPVMTRPPRLLRVAGSKYPPYVTLLSHYDYLDHEYWARG
ncbi:uncharacterized protein N7498_002071 [Penicillium cinerascens]|uniref:Uncharacterized protein n=1 Tax=Penicillium cinerascens TaxID=70096 RepID=A0A9W9NB51_9EURO|nr:uncharacterized protein N7498_002071 [Penicillium cinerascens]KAJ5215664.1 hypothetical protein N7498_002071 [Penicillium cinerascens]